MTSFLPLKLKLFCVFGLSLGFLGCSFSPCCETCEKTEKENSEHASNPLNLYDNLIIKIEIPQHIKSFQQGLIHIQIFQYDPLLADVAATCVKQSILGCSHKEGSPSYLQSSFYVAPQKNKNYYLVANIFSDSLRQHKILGMNSFCPIEWDPVNPVIVSPKLKPLE